MALKDINNELATRERPADALVCSTRGDLKAQAIDVNCWEEGLKKF